MGKFLPVAVKGWYFSANSSRKVPKRVPPKKNRGFSLESFPLFMDIGFGIPICLSVFLRYGRPAAHNLLLRSL
jgi:hypothetical protein